LTQGENWRTVGKTHRLNEAEPLPYTLGQAAKATGKQKSTILDAIRNGRLSASRDDKNSMFKFFLVDFLRFS
jgi:hypothetical protein